MVRKKESYEELMTRLEEIVVKMEEGELSLDDSIKYYEEGVITCNRLYKLLNQAESKIKILTDGIESDFEDEEQL